MSTPRPIPATRKRLLTGGAIALGAGVIAVDQGTKWWAEAQLTERNRIPLLGDLFGLQLAYNPGAAFSLGENATWIFTILSVAAAVAAIVAAFKVRRTSWAVIVGLLGGAAATHAIDRLFRAPSFGNGHVVDFLAYGNWFIGNVADIVIFTAAVAAVLIALKSPVRPLTESATIE